MAVVCVGAMDEMGVGGDAKTQQAVSWARAEGQRAEVEGGKRRREASAGRDGGWRCVTHLVEKATCQCRSGRRRGETAYQEGGMLKGWREEDEAKNEAIERERQRHD